MLYRGGEGQWAWVLHRVTGVGVLLFLFAHIIDTVLVVWGPEVYDKVINLYKQPIFRVLEVGLLAAVLYHALNGMRIIIVDFWEETTRYQRQMFYWVLALFALIFLPSSWIMLKPMLIP